MRLKKRLSFTQFCRCPSPLLSGEIRSGDVSPRPVYLGFALLNSACGNYPGCSGRAVCPEALLDLPWSTTSTWLVRVGCSGRILYFYRGKGLPSICTTSLSALLRALLRSPRIPCVTCLVVHFGLYGWKNHWLRDAVFRHVDQYLHRLSYVLWCS